MELNDSNFLIYAIKKSCNIKLHFVNKDVNEKNIRMILNFGHTFAHAIEIKNNYSKNITHGEAVLSGMILATKLSRIKKVCDKKTLDQIIEIYKKNSLEYTYEKYSNYKMINSLIPYLENDKKNNDDKINFIFIKKVGKIDVACIPFAFIHFYPKHADILHLYRYGRYGHYGTMSIIPSYYCN